MRGKDRAATEHTEQQGELHLVVHVLCVLREPQLTLLLTHLGCVRHGLLCLLAALNQIKHRMSDMLQPPLGGMREAEQSPGRCSLHRLGSSRRSTLLVKFRPAIGWDPKIQSSLWKSRKRW